jgi:hypothetical protein
MGRSWIDMGKQGRRWTGPVAQPGHCVSALGNRQAQPRTGANNSLILPTTQSSQLTPSPLQLQTPGIQSELVRVTVASKLLFISMHGQITFLTTSRILLVQHAGVQSPHSSDQISWWTARRQPNGKFL